MELFEIEPISDEIIRIKMPYVCSYIIKGHDRAVLIDTGFGYGDLKKIVDNILDIPYDVICSHGHPDHAGGNMQFDLVYLPEDDFELVKYGTQVETRHKIMNSVMRRHGKSFPKENFIPYEAVNYVSYNESNVFDLGGITIKPIHLPGHTKGIMGFIIPELEVAMLGDACANPTLLNLDSSAPVKEYRDALIKLSKLKYTFNEVLIQHNAFSEPISVINDNLYWAEQILLNKDDRLALRLSGKESYVARNKNTQHLTGNSGNIIYTSDSL
ncbi:MBL fold metallo-hydrolase [Aerococcaceae bacterium DSM 111021]|nr:MBL fold metallo-hydrolase [Aerococcaceae bacterium DSM 111021]